MDTMSISNEPEESRETWLMLEFVMPTGEMEQNLEKQMKLLKPLAEVLNIDLTTATAFTHEPSDLPPICEDGQRLAVLLGCEGTGAEDAKLLMLDAGHAAEAIMSDKVAGGEKCGAEDCAACWHMHGDGDATYSIIVYRPDVDPQTMEGVLQAEGLGAAAPAAEQSEPEVKVEYNQIVKVVCRRMGQLSPGTAKRAGQLMAMHASMANALSENLTEGKFEPFRVPKLMAMLGTKEAAQAALFCFRHTSMKKMDTIQVGKGWVVEGVTIPGKAAPQRLFFAAPGSRNQPALACLGFHACIGDTLRAEHWPKPCPHALQLGATKAIGRPTLLQDEAAKSVRRDLNELKMPPEEQCEFYIRFSVDKKEPAPCPRGHGCCARAAGLATCNGQLTKKQPFGKETLGLMEKAAVEKAIATRIAEDHAAEQRRLETVISGKVEMVSGLPQGAGRGKGSGKDSGYGPGKGRSSKVTATAPPTGQPVSKRAATPAAMEEDVVMTAEQAEEALLAPIMPKKGDLLEAMVNEGMKAAESSRASTTRVHEPVPKGKAGRKGL